MWKYISVQHRTYGIHSSNVIRAAGFEYTGKRDAAHCNKCGLEVSNWTLEMRPFDVHKERKPDCPFVQSVTSSKSMTKRSLSATTTDQDMPQLGEHENSSKRQKKEESSWKPLVHRLDETNSLVQARDRGFSHWPHRIAPTKQQMMKAGFFSCNMGDRVICIYCNLICQQWTPHTDDPCEVHETISPNCIYVKAKLTCSSTAAIPIVNNVLLQSISSNSSSTTVNLGSLQSNGIALTAGCNPAYAELPKRHASFATWPQENLTPIDDLVRAGFFYTGTKTIVTCFYCNGSLKNWTGNAHPMIEHARWFPHCAYAKQFCGDERYRKIQEFERVRAHHEPVAIGRRVLALDDTTLSRMVAARLDLPVSQRLLNKNIPLFVIRRCWENQLRLKRE